MTCNDMAEYVRKKTVTELQLEAERLRRLLRNILAVAEYVREQGYAYHSYVSDYQRVLRRLRRVCEQLYSSDDEVQKCMDYYAEVEGNERA